MDNISDLKLTINSTIFGVNKEFQNHHTFSVVHSAYKLKDDVVIKERFKTKLDNHIMFMIKRVLVMILKNNKNDPTNNDNNNNNNNNNNNKDEEIISEFSNYLPNNSVKNIMANSIKININSLLPNPSSKVYYNEYISQDDPACNKNEKNNSEDHVNNNFHITELRYSKWYSFCHKNRFATRTLKLKVEYEQLASTLN